MANRFCVQDVLLIGFGIVTAHLVAKLNGYGPYHNQSEAVLINCSCDLNNSKSHALEVVSLQNSSEAPGVFTDLQNATIAENSPNHSDQLSVPSLVEAAVVGLVILTIHSLNFTVYLVRLRARETVSTEAEKTKEVNEENLEALSDSQPSDRMKKWESALRMSQ